MLNIILLALVAILVVVGIRLFLQRAPKYGPWFLVRVGLIILAIIVVILALTGRLHWLLGLLAGLIPIAKRFLPIAFLRLIPFLGSSGTFGQGQTSSNGQQSEVTTEVLKMTLDHDSGDMDGKILAGPFQGSLLSSLNVEQLKDVYNHCQQHDHEAMRLLESYLQRHHSDEWTQKHNNQSNDGSNNSDLSIDEALEILELSGEPNEEEILKAHKRMMTKFHPDKGGSHYMAVKINQAKELLLSRL